jgi:hypothetical protein
MAAIPLLAELAAELRMGLQEHSWLRAADAGVEGPSVLTTLP